MPVPRGRPTSRRRGFTFTEILFAVLILGIGFILVAAIFPVALRQTQVTGEETAGATIAKGGVAYLEKYTSQAYWSTPYSPTGTPSVTDGKVHAIGPIAISGEPIATNTVLWGQLSSNFILPTDPRYAWVAMYRQPLSTSPATPGNLPYLQLIVIGVQARNRSFYDSNDLVARPTATPGIATLQARALLLTAVNAAGEQFTFGDVNPPYGAGSIPSNLGCVSDSAFVVIASDSNGGATNGWIYRLGTNAGGTTWGLAPGNDMSGTPAPPTPGVGSIVYVVGSGYSDKNATTTTYSGPCQDVAAYTTFIPVH
jgi:prepilin-type N-terminal cleavage/methylation domain-containing protein